MLYLSFITNYTNRKHLVESFMFLQSIRFDLKEKKQLATQEKYYLVDAGLLNVLAGKDRITDSFTQNRSGVKHLNLFNWLLETSSKNNNLL